MPSIARIPVLRTNFPGARGESQQIVTHIFATDLSRLLQSTSTCESGLARLVPAFPALSSTPKYFDLRLGPCPSRAGLSSSLVYSEVCRLATRTLPVSCRPFLSRADNPKDHIPKDPCTADKSTLAPGKVTPTDTRPTRISVPQHTSDVSVPDSRQQSGWNVRRDNPCPSRILISSIRTFQL